MKLVVITSRFPYPIEKGDKLRAFNHIKALSADHNILLISTSHEEVGQSSIEALRPYCSGIEVFKINNLKHYFNLALSVFDSIPFQVGYFYDRNIKRKIQEKIINFQPDHIFCQLIRSSEYVKNLPFPKTLDYMDVFSEGMRQRQSKSWFPLKQLYRWEKKLIKRYERDIYKHFDHHCIISTQDRQRLPLPSRERIVVVPNGVDIDFFSATDTQKKFDLCFVGNMGYFPNIEAVKYLVKYIVNGEILSKRDLKVLIAGARPHPSIMKLASDRIEVSGWMEDIRQAYNQSRVMVAPMFSGMGQQNKILEAMSMSIPCVTTALVNNAIKAQPGEHLMIAKNYLEFQERICKLLDSPRKMEKMGQNARSFIEQNYSWQSQNEKLKRLILKESPISTHLY